MTDLEHAQAMMSKYRDLLSQCGGMTSITIDGQTYQFDDLQRQYQFWRSEFRRYSGKVGSIQSLDLSKA